MQNLDVQTPAMEGTKMGDSQNIEAPPVPPANLSPDEALEAFQGAVVEHQMSFSLGLGIYKKALLWALVMSTTLVMEAYDNHLLSNFYALPSFQMQFGTRVAGKTVKYEIPAKWQSGLSASKLVGIIVGCEINKWVVDWYGYRRVTLVSIMFMAAFVFILFFAQNLVTILFAELLFNIPFGIVSVLVQAYSMELLPLGLRHLGPNIFQLMRSIGALIAAGILQGMSGIDGQWAWRIPVAVQWAWPVPLIILIYFAPESPWWLVRKRRFEEALCALGRLSTSDVQDKETLALIAHTVQIEEKLEFGGRLVDCFKGVNLRRTEIEVAARAFNSLATFGLASGTFFFENAGLSPSHSFALNTGTTALSAVATFSTMFILAKVGRRTLWLCGISFCCLCLIILASCASTPHQTPGIIWAQGVLLMIHNGVISLSTAPLAAILGTEVASVQLRQKTLSLSANVSNLWEIVTGYVSPYLLNADQANLGGKAAWIPAGVDILIISWAYFRLPETKGRSIEELDYLFAQGIPTPKFKSFVIPSGALYTQVEVKDPVTRPEERKAPAPVLDA